MWLILSLMVVILSQDVMVYKTGLCEENPVDIDNGNLERDKWKENTAKAVT